jgi:hypothetical protein
MIHHRAKSSPAPIDIAPGAAARLRLRPALDVEEAPRPTPVSPTEAPAPATTAPAVDVGAMSAALARAQAERDAAVEEAAYLREQLQSTHAYLAHVLETERATGFFERASLLNELAVLDEELRARGGEVVPSLSPEVQSSAP